MKYSIVIVITFFSCLCLFPFFSDAQSNQVLKIGDPVPSFKFSMINDSRKTADLKDYKGQLILLDFWTTNCLSCIEGMPKMEALQKQFGSKIKVILVNAWEDMAKIKERAGNNKKFRPGIGFSDLPSSIGDSSWRKIFPHNATPYHVWIDPSGKVVAMTYPGNMTTVNIQKALEGKPLDFLTVKFFEGNAGVMLKKGMVSVVDTARPPSRYAAFSPYTIGLSTGEQNEFVEEDGSGTSISFSNYSIVDLYARSVWYARRLHLPVLIEAPGSMVEYFPTDHALIESWCKKNSFCVQLFEKDASKEQMGEWMFEELNNFFGRQLRIKAEVERRKIIHYHLAVDYNKMKIDEAKLKMIEDGNSVIKIQNGTANDLFDIFQSRFGNLKIPRIVSYNGNMQKKIDLVLTGDLNDVANLRRQLKPYGIDFREAMREIEVIVIKDK